MIVKALRVADLGPFANGVALEGLSGGLDVLVDSNEAGKSSLFRALVTLIEEKHTANSRRIDALRHAGGGAPLIEADVEIAGRTLRIRKRYITQRLATVQDLSTGQITRGADAETYLASLFSPPALDDAPRRLLWVAQSQSFELAKPEADAGTTLAHLIEQEAANATGSGLARRVAAAIAEELGELQTTHSTPRPRGRLLAAQSQHKAALEALAHARVRADSQTARRADLDRLQAEKAVLTDPAHLTALRDKLQASQRAYDEGVHAREQLNTACERFTAATRIEAAAQAELVQFQNEQAELQKLTQSIASREAALATLATQEQSARTALGDLETRQAALITTLETTRTRLRQRTARDAHDALATLDQRIAEATVLTDRIVNLERSIAHNPVRDADVAALRRLASDISRAEAEANASAARVEIAYAPGATHRLVIDGRTIDADETMTAHTDLIVAIPGIGEIRIKPGASDAARAAARAETFRTEHATLLAKLGTPNIAAVEARLATAATETSALAQASALLASVAPRGIAALARERDLLAATIDPSIVPASTELDTRAELDLALSRLESQRSALDSSLATARTALSSAAQALVRCQAEQAADRQRHDALQAQLIDAASRHATLVETLANAKRASAEAQRQRDTWQALTLNDIRLAAIANERDRASHELARHDARLQELNRRIAELTGELRSDDANGVGHDLVRCEEQAAEAATALAACQREAAALILLAARLKEAQARTRSSTLRPLTDRLAPLLHQLLPGTSLDLSGLTQVSTLVRSGRAESFDQLSAGTREQIAVLVRLAWARILTERGRPTPLVLDDALVYSDDERLQRMFAILADAARTHQVIVLSCHAQTTRAASAAANANLVSISTWRAEEPVALRAHG